MRTRCAILAVLVVVGLSAVLSGNGDSAPTFGGGGPMPSILFLRLETLNAAITSVGYPRISEVLFTIGGGGFGGRQDGVRFGGMGASGTTVSTTEDRSSRLGIDYYGVLVEKAAGSNGDFTVVLGSMLGGGSLDLRLVQRIPLTFEDAVGTPYLALMSKGFYAVQPYVAFETEVFPWMWARLQLGFLWTLSERWEFEDVEFSGPPRSLTGLVASVRVQFGGTNDDKAHDEDAETEEPLEEGEAQDEDTDEPQP